MPHTREHQGRLGLDFCHMSMQTAPVPVMSTESSAAPLRVTTLAALWLAFWLLMICTAMQDALRNPATAWWEPLTWEGSSAIVATGWLCLALRMRRSQLAYLDRPLVWCWRYLRWLPLVAVSFIVAVYAIRSGVYALMDRSYDHPEWHFVLIYETLRLLVFLGLWLGILFGLDSHAQWQLQRHRYVQARKALAEAQLARLQGQLRPHFLFNALNTVSSLMHSDVARADRLVAALGDLLRISLQAAEHEMTTLGGELRALRLYTDIMCERFRGRVTLAWQIAPSLEVTPFPTLLLQPLLENAFKHGVEGTVGPVSIGVSAQRRGDCLDIVVRNSNASLAMDARDGVGLRNCRERLALLYGDAASLRICSDGRDVVARLVVPLSGPAR
ncbi:sensor histidine kinase [Stenotrophomonas sp. AB1(2024)]|uniref:sensor histidine kinase n=1 Tax=Stenotrophomonas sp. AB1(2024) TaxID=3132215 RepID=UPI0030A562A1